MLKQQRTTAYRQGLIVLLSLLGMMPIAQASMLERCAAPESNYPAYIHSMLSRIGHHPQDSNTASIAFIMAAAITARYNIPVDAEKISSLLNHETLGIRPISMLDIKRVFTLLGLQVDARKTEQPEEVLTLSSQILITQDQQKNFMALITTSNSYAYLIYGVVNQEALICPVHKSVFMKSYTTEKFLILN
ncbi:hypothetical protein [Aquirhabdus parva]|uniref:Peptidase C39 domain-containing protein n=1 Tax=Aquirhabdus parva TaxID=2283318 RepID=A0A345P9S6_9GAMM|nr:hypothetical protein [Aquirhabdus parva]AXI04035.1 hypothetical protein HYN46_15020 [Aquirhabdus parva]